MTDNVRFSLDGNDIAVFERDLLKDDDDNLYRITEIDTDGNVCLIGVDLGDMYFWHEDASEFRLYRRSSTDEPIFKSVGDLAKEELERLHRRQKLNERKATGGNDG